MGGAGDSPAPVGDPPTGTERRSVSTGLSSLARNTSPIPSGGSPDGTGGSPVLPGKKFSDRLSALRGQQAVKHIGLARLNGDLYEICVGRSRQREPIWRRQASGV